MMNSLFDEHFFNFVLRRQKTKAFYISIKLNEIIIKLSV